MKRKIILISFAITASFLISANACFADGYWVEKEVEISRNYIYNTAVFSHNSAGYWQCSNAKIYDSSINYTLGYGSCTGTVDFIYSLPSSVVSALKNGTVKVYLESPGSVTCVDYKHFSYSFNGLSSLNYSLSLFPRFAPRYTLNRFVKGISGTVPLVESPYGRNLYRIYRFGSAYTVSGYFNSSNVNQKSTYCLHPSQIIDSMGNILNSATLSLNGNIYKGNFCTIGNGDFANRGSVYLEFDCPIILRFTTITKEFIYTGSSSSGTDTNSKSDDSGGSSNKEDDSQSKEETKTDEKEETEFEDPNDNEKEDSEEPSFNRQIHRVK